jgi:hypothetical protein
MNVLKIATAVTIGLFATAAQAADSPNATSPIVGQFPQTEHNEQTFLFFLKKNDISIDDMSADDFCSMMDYGKAVKADQPDVAKNGRAVRGPINWVICRFKNK